MMNYLNELCKAVLKALKNNDCKIDDLITIKKISCANKEARITYRGCGMLQATNFSTMSGFLIANENPTVPPQSCTTSVHFS